MLVLSRKCGERLFISETIEVTVISVQGDRVRLGFNAPADVPIHRAEIQQRLEQERLAARQPTVLHVAQTSLALMSEGATTCP